MNLKTFTLAVIFLVVTILWLGINFYWYFSGKSCIFNLLIAIVFVAVAALMVYNEFGNKRRTHIDEVVKNKIP